ncbi:MAG: hypothetical protein L3K07_02260, partial [Thermoplasmata archaeon]|nr:hypothetical protein [Thermoplasmata archaeon]
IFPMWFRYHFRALLNEADAYATDYWYYIIKKEHPKALAAYLNSRVARLCLEVIGRQYSGMLHLKLYELKDLPSLDPSAIDSATAQRLEDLFDGLQTVMENAGLAGSDSAGVVKARDEMDAAVADAIQLSPADLRSVKRALLELQQARASRKR